MANALHSRQTVDDGIHIPYAFTYIDAASRLADIGRSVNDHGKFARQLDDDSIWMLIDTTPTWAQVNAPGGSVGASRNLIAGDGLTGGGNLSADRTFSVGADPSGSISVSSDYISVGIINASQHGIQTGSNLHGIATQTDSGFMSATDKVNLDLTVSGSVTIPVRNESGGSLLKGYAVAIVGWNSPTHTPLVAYADKDIAALSNAVGILTSDLANNASGRAIISGLLEGLNTNSFSINDSLVLGNSGTLVRPPPVNSPFTGIVQTLCTVARVDLIDGHVAVQTGDPNVITATQVFALSGSYGTPSATNVYVTDLDPRNSDSRVGYALKTATSNVYISSSTAPVSGSVLIALSSTNAQWEPLPTSPLSSTVPITVARTTALAGTSSFAARSDHQHDVSVGDPAALTVGGALVTGTSSSLSRADHVHSLPPFGTVTGSFAEGNDARLSNQRIAYAIASATTIVYVSASAAPTSGSTLNAISSTQAAWEPKVGLTTTAPANVTKAAATVGTSTLAARSDHKHDITTDVGSSWTVGSAASEGTSTALARADHVHAVGTPAAPANVTKAAASAGVSTDPARADHKHDITTATATALTVGVSNAEGVSTSLARADHTHAISAGTPVDVASANSAGVATTFSRSDHVHNVPFLAVHNALSGATFALHFNDQDLNSVGDINGIHYFPTSSADPVTPTPVGGDRYYNTVIHEFMTYDAARGKFLSTAQMTIMAGASGATLSGSFFRAMDGFAYQAGVGNPVPKGTITGLGVVHTDATTPIIEVLVNDVIITAMTASGAGMTANWLLNADFDEGYLQFRNKGSGGATSSNTQITALTKRRV